MKTLAAVLIAGTLATASGCAGSSTTPSSTSPSPGTTSSDPALELTHDTALRRALVKAAMNLPEGASLEEIEAQAKKEGG